eukprot:7094435-Lingulodinium_polyedra.AAC.1
MPEDTEDTLTMGSSPSHWQSIVGDDKWPVKRENVEDFVRRSSATLQGEPGFVTTFRKVRQSTKARWLFRNEGRIPAKETIRWSMTCCNAHFGLCVTRDAGIFGDAFRLGGFMERFFVKTMVGDAFALSGDDQNVDYLLLVHVRSRRPLAQTTHVFAVLERRGNDMLFMQRAGHAKMFWFVTQFGLAKHVFRHGALSNLVVDKLQLQKSCGRIVAQGDQQLGQGTCIWPTLRKEARATVDKSSAEAALDRLSTKEPPRTCKKDGGSCGIRPTASCLDVDTRRQASVQGESTGEGEDDSDADDGISEIDIDTRHGHAFHKGCADIDNNVTGCNNVPTGTHELSSKAEADDEDHVPLMQRFGEHAAASHSATQAPQEGMATSSGSRVCVPRGPALPRFNVHGPDGTHLGYLVWNRAANSIDAHCSNPLHSDGWQCAVNRTVNMPTKARPNQGRPL